MARNIRIDRSEAEFLTDLLMSSDNPIAKDLGDEIRKVFGMVSENKEKQLTDNPKNFDTLIAESNELIKKLGDVWATGIKDIYGSEHQVSADQWPSDAVKTYAEAAKLNINKINPTILDIVDAASKATIERIDTSNRPIVYDVALNPEIIKLPNVTIRPLRDGDRVKVKLGGCDEWFTGTVIRARKQEVELDPHEYTYPKIADETNIVDIRII